jgi:hypothetical protein
MPAVCAFWICAIVSSETFCMGAVIAVPPFRGHAKGLAGCACEAFG